MSKVQDCKSVGHDAHGFDGTQYTAAIAIQTQHLRASARNSGPYEKTQHGLVKADSIRYYDSVPAFYKILVFRFVVRHRHSCTAI